MTDPIARRPARPTVRDLHPLRGLATAVLAVAFALAASPATALTLDEVRGNIGVGYSRLFITDAPGGSLTTTAGVSIPVRGDWSAGIGVGFDLLGSRTVPRGSLVAGVDYSMFETGLFLHWAPQHLGPIGRISGAAELMSCRAELSSSGGGAGFSDLAKNEVVPGVGLDVTLMRRRMSPVRVGLELGARLAFTTGEDWTMATSRLVFHF